LEDKDFYKNLPAIELPLAEVFQRNAFSPFASGWHVVIADVKNSTAAVNGGKHDDVNLVSAGCLVVALNIAKAANVEIPFFFTGDGGTAFVPSIILEEVLQGLKTHNQNSIENFGLEFHIGSIPITQITAAGHLLYIAKVQFAKNFSKPVIIGDGLQYAERLVKGASPNILPTDNNNSELNMEGLECRWDKIKPPDKNKEIVCYLVETFTPQKQAEVYGQVLQKMDEIYGEADRRNPVSIDSLRLLISVRKIKKETMAHFGFLKKKYIIIGLLETFIGRLYFYYNWRVNKLRGQEYLKQIVANADTLTIDGRINTILLGTKDQRLRFVQYLQQQEQAGHLLYGHFRTSESIMTCYIENRNKKHIHFVDGSDGGYTEAAKELKLKLKNRGLLIT